MEEAEALKMQAFVNAREPSDVVEILLGSVPLSRILGLAASGGEVLAKRTARLVVSTKYGADRLLIDQSELVLSGLRSGLSEAASLLSIAFEHSSQPPSAEVLEALGEACEDSRVSDAAAAAVAKLSPEFALIALGSRQSVRALDAAVRCAMAWQSPESVEDQLDRLLEIACSEKSDDPLNQLTALELLSTLASQRQGATFLLRQEKLKKLMGAASRAEDSFHRGDRALAVLGKALGSASLEDWDASSRLGQDFLDLALNRFREENERVAAFHALGFLAATPRLEKVLNHPVSQSWLDPDVARETHLIRTARLESLAKAFECDADLADAAWTRVSTKQRAAVARDAASGHHQPLKLAAMRLIANAISNTTLALSDLVQVDGFYPWLVDETEPFDSEAVDDAKLSVLKSVATKTPSPFNDATQSRLRSLLTRRTERVPSYVPQLAGERGEAR